jgi:arylsulfatase A-like enzyme
MSKRRPNVILIVTDDQGFGDIASHGNPVLVTPNLDELRAESVRLTDFHVDPMCAPSRAALMTGRYSARTGVWSTLTGRYIMRQDEVTMAQVFADSGYRTGIFGKWHLGDNYPYRPQDRGFQETLTFGAGVVGEIPDYWNNDYFKAVYQRNGYPEHFEKYCTNVWFDEAIKYIEECGDVPFFCYIPTNAPHSPFNVHERYSEPYLKLGIPSDRARFYGMITNIDENLGRMRKRLEDLSLTDDTIIIFLGDNGTAAGVSVDRDGFRMDGYNAGMRGKKCWAYEGGHRNACFIHWPGGGLTGGRDVDVITAHLDLLPTLIDLCTLDPPDGIRFDGSSLVPYFRGELADWPDRTLFVHNQQRDRPKKYKDIQIMTGQWRLAVTEQWGPGLTELFDARKDPQQRRDISRQHPDVMKALMKLYDYWWEDISVRFGEYSDIIIGSDSQPITKFTCHAWHGEKGLYNQSHVRQGIQDNGFWTVEVERSSVYEFTLRRWPEEANTPIRAAIPPRTGVPFVDDLLPGVSIPIIEARLKIGDVDLSQTVGGRDKVVVFQAHLPAGSTRLQTWFIDENQDSRGAYYVYARFLDAS